MRGVPLELHPPGDYVSDVVRRTGDFYEAAILDEIRRRISGGVLIDAGAMIGNHTAFLAAFVPHTAIHAFEPLPANLALLRRNVARYPTVEVHPLALSDHHGTVGMTLDPVNHGHGSIEEGAGQPFYVPAATLDSLELVDVTLIKVDVEGHEAQVLAGARETIADSRPLIVAEDWPGNGYALPDYYRLVADWGTAHQTYAWAA